MSGFRTLRGPIVLCAALCAVLLLGACTPASRMVHEPAPGDGVSVGAQSDESAGIGVVVDRVIVRNGPGAWVKDAAWDEYAIRLEARGDAPVRVLDVALASEHLAEAAHATAQLDALEKGTGAQVHLLQTAGVSVALGYGAGALAFAGAAGGAAPVGAIAGAYAAIIVMPIAAIAGGVYMHKKHKRQKADRVLMQEEIGNRALALPLEIAPGSPREGAWFFPITPAPTRLQVRYEQGGVEHEMAVALPQLAQLHMKAPPTQDGPAKPKHHR